MRRLESAVILADWCLIQLPKIVGWSGLRLIQIHISFLILLFMGVGEERAVTIMSR